MRQTLHEHGHNTEELIKKMPSPNESAKAGDIFRLLSDTTRIRILWLLCHSEECVTNIATAVDMSAPAVSHHLRFLKQSDILTYRRDGKETYYTLADNAYAELIHKMIDDVFRIQCPNKD